MSKPSLCIAEFTTKLRCRPRSTPPRCGRSSRSVRNSAPLPGHWRIVRPPTVRTFLRNAFMKLRGWSDRISPRTVELVPEGRLGQSRQETGRDLRAASMRSFTYSSKTRQNSARWWDRHRSSQLRAGPKQRWTTPWASWQRTNVRRVPWGRYLSTYSVSPTWPASMQSIHASSRRPRRLGFLIGGCPRGKSRSWAQFRAKTSRAIYLCWAKETRLDMQAPLRPGLERRLRPRATRRLSGDRQSPNAVGTAGRCGRTEFVVLVRLRIRGRSRPTWVRCAHLDGRPGE